MTSHPDDQTIASLRTFTEVARHIPSFRAGHPVHASTLSRWRARGVAARDGRRIKLQAVRAPGGWRTSVAWVMEFFEALAQDRNDGERTVPEIRTQSARHRDAVRAQRELAKIGI